MMKKSILFLFAFSGFLVISFGIASLLYAQQSLQGVKFNGTLPTCNESGNNTISVATGTLKICYGSTWNTVTGGGSSGGDTNWTLTGSILHPSSTSWKIGVNTTTVPSAGKMQVDGGHIYVTNGEAGAGTLRVGGAWGMPGIYNENAAKNLLIGSANGMTFRVNAGNNTYPDTMTILANGNVGVSNSNPTYLLTVGGAGYFAQPVIVAEPTAPEHAATKNYVDSALGGSSLWTYDSGTNSVMLSNMGYEVNIGDASGVDFVVGGGAGKVDVGTVDPVYTIGGNHYATYFSGMTGVKEETAGILTLKQNGKNAVGLLDFKNAEVGSDFWLFAKTTNLKKNFNALSILVTPGFEGKVWYKKDAENLRVTIYGDQSGEVSYRLTAPRFDTADWKNTRTGDEEGFNLDKLIKE